MRDASPEQIVTRHQAGPEHQRAQRAHEPRIEAQRVVDHLRDELIEWDVRVDRFLPAS
jgi:hypothetical protein